MAAVAQAPCIRLDGRQSSYVIDVSGPGMPRCRYWGRRLPASVDVAALPQLLERPLPRAVRGSIAATGEPRPAVVLARLAARPWELPALLDLRRDSTLALRALAGLTRALGPALAGYGADSKSR